MEWRRARPALGLVVTALCLATPAAVSAQDIACDRGDREVVGVNFVGNRSFPDPDLLNRIVTTPSSWARRTLRFVGARRCLDTLEVRRDPVRLLVFYSRRGFTGTRVVTQIDTTRPRVVKVTFGIQEGSPVILDQFSITGLDSVPRSDRITADLPIQLAGRFDQDAIEAARELITRRLRDNGYPTATIFRSFESDTAKRVANLRFEVVTGPRARIGVVNIAVTPREEGDQQVSATSVRRTASIEPGDLYRERDLEAAKRALYLSDAYRHVELAPDTSTLEPVGDSTIDVNIGVAESFMKSLRPSVGWATLDCFRARVDYSDVGFLGALRRLDVSARASKVGVGYPTAVNGPMRQICSESARDDTYSDTLNYYVGATLRQSSLFGIRAVPTVTVYSELRSEYLVYRRYTPVGGILSLNQQLRGGIGTTYAYQLEYGRTAAEPAIFCGVIGVCDVDEQAFLKESQRLAAASVTFGRDRRNDPFYPTAGSSMSLELRNASRFIGSDPDLQFTKLVGDASWYWALPRQSVLVARLRGGVVFGQRIALGTDTSVFIPQQERLYAGGANTVRGFRQNELGPVVYLPDTVRVCAEPTGPCVTPATAQDTVYFSSDTAKTPSRILPVGGNTVAVANVELRMPSPFIPDRLQLAFFVDAGQVWTRGASGAEQSFGNLRFTPGVGVRIASPVGPIRLDVGFNPYNRDSGAAYFDAPAGSDLVAPLFCISPRNGLPVTGWTPDRQETDPQPVQAGAARGCPTSFQPEPRGGFFRRLSLHASIGQAF